MSITLNKPYYYPVTDLWHWVNSLLIAGHQEREDALLFRQQSSLLKQQELTDSLRELLAHIEQLQFSLTAQGKDREKAELEAKISALAKVNSDKLREIESLGVILKMQGSSVKELGAELVAVTRERDQLKVELAAYKQPTVDDVDIEPQSQYNSELTTLLQGLNKHLFWASKTAPANPPVIDPVTQRRGPGNNNGS